jgi:hypothetical protein
MTDETPRKGEHRERQGLLGRARDRFERMEPKRQALLLAVAAAIALAATIALNPFQSTTSDQPEPQSAQQATDGGKDTKNQSRTDPSSEPSGFTGSTEDIANKVRSILNSPDGGNIDTFGQTLIRHDDKDLGNATDLFDAIGRQEKESTVRALADEWYAEALPKAAGYRLDDLKSSLPKAEHAVDRLPDPTPDDCTGLAKAAKQARALVDAGSDDYDKLTSAQQTLTKSISACTANMTVDQIDRLFPQDGPSVTIPDTTRREHSGSGIRLGIGSCPGIAKILPAGIRGITLPDGTRVRMLRCVTREGGADIPVALIPATGAVHNRMLGAAGGQIVEFAGRPRLYRPEKGGPILAFTVTDLRIRDTDEARMLRAGRTHG